jgi:dTDP-4-amino-4,6-dideoxygalactose transaminase
MGFSEPTFVSAYPGLSFRELLAGKQESNSAFFVGANERHYFYFARNAIFALAGHWGIAGKEVLLPSYMEGIEAECFVSAGVNPKFYPVGLSLQVRAEDILAQVRPQTSAVYITHYFGFPMREVVQLSKALRDRGLFLIEDCAHALGSCLGEVPLGSFGDAAIFSFRKTIGIPNGGALVLARSSSFKVENETAPWASTVAYLLSSLKQEMDIDGPRWAGQILGTAIRLGSGLLRRTGTSRVSMESEVFDPKLANLGMSRLAKRILLSQEMKSLIATRRRNYLRLYEQLGELAPPITGALSEGICPLIYPVRVDDKDDIMRSLRAHGIQAADHWPKMQLRLDPGEFSQTRELHRSIIGLPCHQNVTSQQIDRMGQVVLEILEQSPSPVAS